MTGEEMHQTERIEERRFGCSLFERHSRGVRLTDAGILVRSFVNTVVSEEIRVRKDLQSLSELRSGRLKIACTSSAIAGPLSEVLKGFSAKYPHIQIEIHRLPNSRIVSAVTENDVDVGIGYNLEKPTGVVLMGHYDDMLAAVVPRQHPIARLAAASVGDLANYPIGSFELTSVKGQMFKKLLDDLPDAIRPQLLTNSLDALKQFCESGAGIAIMCQSTVAHEVGMGMLCAVPLTGMGPIRQEIYARKDAVDSRPVIAFADELRSDSPFTMV